MGHMGLMGLGSHVEVVLSPQGVNEDSDSTELVETHAIRCLDLV